MAGKTIIGEQVSIEGSIQGREDLVIEGVIKGSIRLEKYHLIVGPKGKVEAEIHAGKAVDMAASGAGKEPITLAGEAEKRK